jgi:RCC1 and BTB domain-containing protein
VACSHQNIIFLATIGDVYKWAYPTNDVNNLEKRNLEDQLSIEHLSNIEDKVIIDVACGFSHTLLLSFSGDVYAFGNGEFGQLVIAMNVVANFNIMHRGAAIVYPYLSQP